MQQEKLTKKYKILPKRNLEKRRGKKKAKTFKAELILVPLK